MKAVLTSSAKKLLSVAAAVDGIEIPAVSAESKSAASRVESVLEKAAASMLANVRRLMDRTIDALPSYHLAGIDRDVTDELLRRDGLLPPLRDEEGRDL